MAEMITVGASSTCIAVALQENASSVEGEMFVDTNHPGMVLEGLNRLRLNRALCDVILCCGGQEFSCHRNVLAASSTYFEGMFTSDMLESMQERIQICDVEPEALSMLVDYAYTSKVSISMANVQGLLAAANFFDVKAVKESCCRYLMRHMDEENCVGIHRFAEAHSCIMLERHSMAYILKHFSGVYQQEEFLSLSVERLSEILSSDLLDVTKEDVVFEAAMLWLNKCPTRRLSFEKVLEHIRLPLISPSFLPHVIESLDVAIEYQGCQRFMSEAIDLILDPYCKTARPRRTTVIVTVGAVTEWRYNYKVECFDPVSNQWKTLGRVPEPGLAVVMSDSALYVAGGEYPTEMWRYNVDRNSWRKMADLNKTRSDLSLVMLDGYVFAVGHSYSKKTADSIERYDPNTDTWELWEDVGVPAYDDFENLAVVALDGLLYFIGGASDHKKPNHKYSYETSVWTEVAPMQIARDKPAACALNGKIYIIGGRSYQLKGKGRRRWKAEIVENTMECYNPETNQWTMCAPMQMRHYEPGVAAMDGKIYVLGGLDDDDKFVRDVELYCEETGTWETVGQMCARRYSLSCMCLKLRNDHVATADEVDENDEDDETDDDDDDDDDEDDETDDDDVRYFYMYLAGPRPGENI